MTKNKSAIHCPARKSKIPNLFLVFRVKSMFWEKEGAQGSIISVHSTRSNHAENVKISPYQLWGQNLHAVKDFHTSQTPKQLSAHPRTKQHISSFTHPPLLSRGATRTKSITRYHGQCLHCKVEKHYPTTNQEHDSRVQAFSQSLSKICALKTHIVDHLPSQESNNGRK